MTQSASTDLLTPDEVAAIFRLSRRTILNWRSNGGPDGFPLGFRIGRAVFWQRASIDSYLDARAVQQEAGGC